MGARFRGDESGSASRQRIGQGIAGALRRLEAVHAERPLQADDRALDRLEQDAKELNKQRPKIRLEKEQCMSNIAILEKKVEQARNESGAEMQRIINRADRELKLAVMERQDEIYANFIKAAGEFIWWIAARESMPVLGVPIARSIDHYGSVGVHEYANQEWDRRMQALIEKYKEEL